jgi:hypothetical protein
MITIALQESQAFYMQREVVNNKLNWTGKENSPLVVLDRFLPSSFLHFFGSYRWTGFDDDTVLILGIALIHEGLRLEDRDEAS